MTLSRRSLITGLVSFVAAPAIVRASSLMPVKAIAPYSDVRVITALDLAATRLTIEDFLRAKRMLENNELPDYDRYVFDPQRDIFIPV